MRPRLLKTRSRITRRTTTPRHYLRHKSLVTRGLSPNSRPMKHRYNRGLQEATQERDRSSQRFERVADTLRDILPSGTQVFHHYDSEAPSVQMGRYRIAHHLGGSIEVAYVGD